MPEYRVEIFTQTEDAQPAIKDSTDIEAADDASAEQKAREWVATLEAADTELAFARISHGETVVKNWPLNEAA